MYYLYYPILTVLQGEIQWIFIAVFSIDWLQEWCDKENTDCISGGLHSKSVYTTQWCQITGKSVKNFLDLFIYSFIYLSFHSFNQNILSTYFVSDTFLITMAGTVKITNGVYSWGEIEYK